MIRVDRRTWLRNVGLTSLGLGVTGRLLGAAGDDKRLPVAAVVTEYDTNSHADVIVGKILEGYEQDGGPGPQLKLVSLCTDQVPSGDLSRGLAEEHGFHLVDSIDEAITLGTNENQVAGVLSIGEHGNYPLTPVTRQRMYPRRRFFDAITQSFRRTGRAVPVFSDKHLSYRWADAKHMVDVAANMNFPLMAGSSLPVTWREPELTLPLGCQIEEAMAVGYGGLEAYGFHALETLQCMVERRQGGETGVSSVQAVQGEAIWKTQSSGRWSRELLSAALASQPDVVPGELRQHLSDHASFYLLKYRDGLQATVAMANGVAKHFGFAAKLRGRREPVAAWFRLQDAKPYGHFGFLLNAIEHMIHTGQAAYPVERTLVTTGVLDAAMHSLAEGGVLKTTPELDVRYQPTDWKFASR